MCRMIAAVRKTKHAPIHKYVRRALSYWTRVEGQESGVGMAYPLKQLTIQKSEHTAVQTRFDPEYKQATSLMGHVRWATHGVIATRNSHPFLSEDGQAALMHNGVLGGSAAVRTELTNLGHTFTSETDSEILLHAYEEWDLPNMIHELNNRGVTGTCNFIIMKKDGTIIAHSDGDLYLLDTPNMAIIATNNYPFTTRKGWLRLKSGELITISPEHTITETTVPQLQSKARTLYNPTTWYTDLYYKW